MPSDFATVQKLAMKIKSFVRPLVVLTLLFAFAFGFGCASPKSPRRYLKPSYSKSKYEPRSRTVASEDEGTKRSWFSRKKKDKKQPKLKATPVASRSINDATVYRLRTDDHVIIILRSIPEEQRIEDVLDENGEVTLDHIGSIRAANRTPTELEKAIRRAYLDQKIYKNITVTVVTPTQSYYVRGEIRNPGRFPLTSGVTLVQAIATAGGYTDFANAKKINVIRGGRTFKYDVRNMEKHPEKDVEIEAGDVIVVPRSVF